MDYDPSRIALFHPEARAPLDMDASWPADAVCAEFSRLAYVPFERGQQGRDLIATAVGRIGYGEPGFFDDGNATNDRRSLDSQGFAAIDANGHAIVAFRGTQPDAFRDLLVDANIIPTRWAGSGWVHNGFRNALNSILPEVEAWLDGHTITRLTLTGHSLGAALATLLAGLPAGAAAELVTFGSPRVGNAGFAGSFAGRIVRRYVDTTDIVTRVPPIFYKHLAGQHYIDPEGIIHATEADAPDDDYIKAKRDYEPCGRLRENVPLRNLADHTPINYVAALLGGRTGPAC